MYDEEMDVDAVVAKGLELVDMILRRKPLSEIKEVIAAGAPVWYQDDEGTSPLHAAAFIENNELVRFLIDEGAVWNAGKHGPRYLEVLCRVNPRHDLLQQWTTCTTLLGMLHYLSTMRTATL